MSKSDPRALDPRPIKSSTGAGLRFGRRVGSTSTAVYKDSERIIFVIYDDDDDLSRTRVSCLFF